MITVRLITTVSEKLAVEMARLQEVLLKGKHGRPLDRKLFEEAATTGFLVGAFHATGPIVGMCYLFVKQTLSRKVMLYEELVVDPEYRGLGIADQIDQFLITLAREHGCDCIEGVMPAGNKAVQTVHLRNGFTIREQYPFRLILNQF